MAKPVKNYATDETLCERAALLVQSQIKEANQNRSDLMKDWSDAERLWNGKSVSDTFPSDEIKHVPEPFNRVETIVPRIHGGIFGIGNWFSVAASEDEWMKSEDKVKEVVLWQCMQGDWRFYSDQEDGMRAMSIYGTVVYKNDWFKRKVKTARRKVKSERVEVNGVYLGDKETRGNLELVDTEMEYPRGRPLNIKNVYLDRYCNNITECRYIGDQFEITLDELKQRSEAGDSGEPAYVNVEEYRHDLVNHFNKNPAQRATNPLMLVHPYEMWTEMEIDGKVQPVAIVIGEHLTKNQVLRITPNTFPGAAVPYQVGRYIKRPGEMYGRGAIQPIMGLSAELDEYRTLNLRQFHLSVSPPFIAVDDAQMPDRMLLYPGRVLSSPIKDGLKPVPMPQNPLGFQVEGIMRSDIAQTSRAPDTWAGQSESSRETAFEVGKKLQEAGLSLGRIIRRYALEVLKPMLRNFMALNHMHLSEPIRIRKLGTAAYGSRETFKDIDPSDIQAQFDFEILDISEIALQGNATREWVAFIQALPPEMMSVVKWDRVVRDFLKSMGRDAPEEYVHTQPDSDDLLSAEEEHDVFAAKHEPPVLPQHNHLAHISKHTMFKSTPQYKRWSMQQGKWLGNHIKKHMMEMSKQQEALLQQAAQVGMGGPAPAPQPGASPPRPVPPSGAADQMRQFAGVNQGV